MASLLERAYNPDVLTCLANLSNDEVFTPPELANRVLDLLPEELWRDPTVRILDPFCKSGVFLREAAKRFIKGLEPVYPNLQERVDHIMHEQLFGIAITELTSLLARRSLYCSKFPNGRFSVSAFDGDEGNIRFRNINHTWREGRCVYCGASQDQYDRDAGLETHAYEFIHTTYPEGIFNMKFDVIVGNPPYQLSDGGAQASALPIYHKFIEQAKKLNPHFICMIVPARWYVGGRGLNSFRSTMISDRRIRVLHDYPETSECFPGVNIRGGVCYFLWDRQYSGKCSVINHFQGEEIESLRYLSSGEDGFFIRYNKGLAIIEKVQAFGEDSFSKFVSSSRPFGLRAAFSDFSPEKSAERQIKLYRFGDDGYISRNQIAKNGQWADMWKVIIPEASPGGDEYPHLVLSNPIVSEPGSICTETYLCLGPFDNKETCENISAYIKTRFFRFLVLMLKNTQHTTKKVYQYVPVQDFSRAWTDEELFQKYSLSSGEIEFILSLVKER